VIFEEPHPGKAVLSPPEKLNDESGGFRAPPSFDDRSSDQGEWVSSSCQIAVKTKTGAVRGYRDGSTSPFHNSFIRHEHRS